MRILSTILYVESFDVVFIDFGSFLFISSPYEEVDSIHTDRLTILLIDLMFTMLTQALEPFTASS